MSLKIVSGECGERERQREGGRKGGTEGGKRESTILLLSPQALYLDKQGQVSPCCVSQHIWIFYVLRALSPASSATAYLTSSPFEIKSWDVRDDTITLTYFSFRHT